MHFSIPDTEEFNEGGETFTGYHIHINGVFHCTVRYKQLHNLYKQMKKEYSSLSSCLPKFPSKKILPLSSLQLEDRRLMLEKYIQAVGQDTSLSNCQLFNGFLLSAQQETAGQDTRQEQLDIYLMNGYKITLDVLTNERTDQILEKTCEKLNLNEDFVYYFSLFLIKTEHDGEIMLLRRLQDFESPYISLNTLTGSYKIVLRKSYWDSTYDLDLMYDKVALGLLYIQTVSDLEQGWILCSKETRNTLATLQSRGAKKEYLELARSLKFYGFLQFRPCVCDYPYKGSRVLVAAGNKELNLRVRLMGGDDVRQGSFKVTRMKCWRITTLHNDEDGDNCSSNLELSFEYLMCKDKLQWVTIASEQAILMSMCLQSMVDELLMKKTGLRRSHSSSTRAHHNNKWNYLKRDGSRQIITVPLTNGVTSVQEDGSRPDKDSTFKTTTTPIPTSSSSMTSLKLVAGKIQSKQAVVENECFVNDGIGDDDL